MSYISILKANDIENIKMYKNVCFKAQLNFMIAFCSKLKEHIFV